jgi:hypothetical protein
MERYWKVILPLATVALVACVAIYVWPTAYRSIAIVPSNPRILAAREHRFTHKVQLLTRAGWIDVSALPTGKDTAWDPLANYSPNWRR